MPSWQALEPFINPTEPKNLIGVAVLLFRKRLYMHWNCVIGIVSSMLERWWDAKDAVRWSKMIHIVSHVKVFCIRRSSFMISIHSRVVHLSHEEEASQRSLSNAGEEMSAIFSITTDINDILLVLDRVGFLLLRPAVNQFLSRDQSCQKSGFNFWWRWEASKPIMTRRSNEAKNTNNFLIGIYRHDGRLALQKNLSFWPRSKTVKTI